MTALTQGRNTAEMQGNTLVGPVLGNTVIYPGALIARDANGFLRPGITATGLVGVGRAEELVDASGLANGTQSVTVKEGRFVYANSAAADAITAADIGARCYIVDDQTVAKTNGSNTRSVAGFVVGITDNGVVVRFDAAMARNL